jgi:hypothetical protein
MTGAAPATYYSIMLNALIQRGSIPRTFDPFDLLSNAKVMPSWTSVYNAITETGTAEITFVETGIADTDIIDGVI